MAIDPNDYGAAAGYVTNDQGNYVMPDYSFSSNVTPVNAPTDWTNYSVPDATFDASSFSPADYSSSQFSDFAVSAPETNWWDQAGQNLGSWWDQTTQDAGNWLGDNNINLTSGSGINPDTGYIAPVENFSDIKWEAYTPDPVYVPSVLTSNVVEPGWDWGNLSTWNPDNAGHSMDDVARDVANSSQFKYWMGPSTDAEWKAQDRALDQYQRDNKVDLGLGSPTTKSIWFESTGDGNFTTPWGNPTGEDRKIKPLESPTDWQASAIVTKPLGAPVEQYSVEGVIPMIPIADIKYSNSDVSWSAPAVVAALGNVKVGDVVDGRTITGLNFDDKGSLLSVTSKSKAGYEETNTVKDSPFFVKVQETNNASRGNLEMGDSIKDPFGGSAWKVVGDTRDSTNSIISVTVVSAIDGHKEILTSGYVFNKAKELDGKASTNTSVTHPDSKPVDPVAPVVPVTPDTAGVPSVAVGGTPLTGFTSDKIQSWGRGESSYDKGYTDYLKVLDNTFVVDYSTGKIIGVKDYDQTTGQFRNILYSDKNLNKQDRQLINQTVGWKDGFNEGKMNNVGSVDAGQSLRKALTGGRGGGDSSPYYNTYTGQPTALGAALGLQQDIQLQASAQNNPSYGVGGSNENAAWIRVGNYNVYTQDPNTMSREVQEAIQLTESERPGFMKAIYVGGGWDHVTGKPFDSSTPDSARIPTQFLYNSEHASADTNAEALFGTRVYGGTFTPGGGFKSVLPIKDYQFLAGAGGGYSKQNYLPSEWTRANFSGQKEVNTGEWQDYRTMIQQGEGLKYGQTTTGDILTGANAISRRAVIEATGNKLAQEEGDSKMFAVLSSLHSGISVGPRGQNPLTTEMMHKSQLGKRNNESIYVGLTGGAGRYVDAMVRNPTPVDRDPITGKTYYVPWTWDRYFTPSGTVENTSDRYIPTEIQGTPQHRYQSPYTGQIVEPVVASGYGANAQPWILGDGGTGAFGNIIFSLGEGTNTDFDFRRTANPVNFGVFARPVDYNWIRSGEIPSTPTSGMGTGVIIGTGTAVGYVAPVAPVTSTTLVVPGSDYLKTVYPNWGRTCNNGKCTIVHHSRKSKINSKSRKNINC